MTSLWCMPCQSSAVQYRWPYHRTVYSSGPRNNPIMSLVYSQGAYDQEAVRGWSTIADLMECMKADDFPYGRYEELPELKSEISYVFCPRFPKFEVPGVSINGVSGGVEQIPTAFAEELRKHIMSEALVWYTLGLLPEIDCTYIIANDNLFLWDYRRKHLRNVLGAGYPSLASGGYDQHNRERHVLLSITLCVPRPNVFANHPGAPTISHILVAAYPLQIVIFGVYRMTNDSIGSSGGIFNQSSLRLTEPLFTVASDNVRMTKMIGTSRGRIFMCGADGNLYELTYQRDDEWWICRSKCRKLNHGALSNKLKRLFPFLFSANTDWLTDLCVDETRQPHMVYTLSQNGNISVFSLGENGDEPLTQLCSSSVSSSSSSSSSPPSHRGLGNIFVVPATEPVDAASHDAAHNRSRIRDMAMFQHKEYAYSYALMVITAKGQRLLYRFDEQRSRLYHSAPKDVRNPPHQRVSLSVRSGNAQERGFPEKDEFDSLNVSTAFSAGGVVLMAAREGTSDSLLAFTTNHYFMQVEEGRSETCEVIRVAHRQHTGGHSPPSGVIYSMAEIFNPAATVTMSSPSPTSSAATQLVHGMEITKLQEYFGLAVHNDLATQYVLPKRTFISLYGFEFKLQLFHKLRPIDWMIHALKQKTEPNYHSLNDGVETMKKRFGAEEVCSMCLSLLNSNPDVSKDVQEQARNVFVEVGFLHNDHTTGIAAMMSYASRLLRLMWNHSVIVEADAAEVRFLGSVGVGAASAVTDAVPLCQVRLPILQLRFSEEYLQFVEKHLINFLDLLKGKSWLDLEKLINSIVEKRKPHGGRGYSILTTDEVSNLCHLLDISKQIVSFLRLLHRKNFCGLVKADEEMQRLLDVPFSTFVREHPPQHQNDGKKKFAVSQDRLVPNDGGKKFAVLLDRLVHAVDFDNNLLPFLKEDCRTLLSTTLEDLDVFQEVCRIQADFKRTGGSEMIRRQKVDEVVKTYVNCIERNPACQPEKLWEKLYNNCHFASCLAVCAAKLKVLDSSSKDHGSNKEHKEPWKEKVKKAWDGHFLTPISPMAKQVERKEMNRIAFSLPPESQKDVTDVSFLSFLNHSKDSKDELFSKEDRRLHQYLKQRLINMLPDGDQAEIRVAISDCTDYYRKNSLYEKLCEFFYQLATISSSKYNIPVEKRKGYLKEALKEAMDLTHKIDLMRKIRLVEVQQQIQTLFKNKANELKAEANDEIPKLDDISEIDHEFPRIDSMEKKLLAVCKKYRQDLPALAACELRIIAMLTNQQIPPNKWEEFIKDLWTKALEWSFSKQDQAHVSWKDVAKRVTELLKELSVNTGKPVLTKPVLTESMVCFVLNKLEELKLANDAIVDDFQLVDVIRDSNFLPVVDLVKWLLNRMSLREPSVCLKYAVSASDGVVRLLHGENRDKIEIKIYERTQEELKKLQVYLENTDFKNPTNKKLFQTKIGALLMEMEKKK